MTAAYEQIGLITPAKKEDFAYRPYDTEAIARLRQIIVLRKLRIPLKQILEVLQSADARVAIEAFERNLTDIEGEITALSTIGSVIKTFIEYLTLRGASFALPDDASLLEVVDSLTGSKISFKQEKSMAELNRANENLSKLADKDVRIVYLPLMTVAAAYAGGEGCEGRAADMIAQFISQSGLLTIKHDARSFGFDCSKEAAVLGKPSHVYEVWVSIPDDMAVPAPLVKRTFDGGLYANGWGAPRWASPETVAGQGFEETLNFYHFTRKGSKMEDLQLDLLFPIKEKTHDGA